MAKLLFCLILTLTLAPLSLAYPTRTSAACTADATCQQTSGCRLLAPPTVNLGIQIRRFSREHINGLLSEFQILLEEQAAAFREVWDEWERFSDMALPVSNRGFLELYPTSANTSTLTNTLPRNKDRILREMRWWLTTVEANIQLVKSADLLGPVLAPGLVEKISSLSRSLNSLINVFGVNTDTLPVQSVCRETSTAISDSPTRRAEFVSMSLRDVSDAMSRMFQVIQTCQVLPHPTGVHMVKLRCGQWSSSLFYASAPSHLTLHSYLDYLHED